MIERVRPTWGPDDMARIYAAPHDHRIYGRGHAERVAATIELARTVPATSGADLSCGNGIILNSLGLFEPHFGDYAPGYQYHGPIEATIRELPYVDLFICSETLEHLDDPPAVLAEIRTKAANLVCSTPIEAWGDTNAEHLWAWDREAVEAMLTGAGFNVKEFTSVDSRAYGEPYWYGIWRCS